MDNHSTIWHLLECATLCVRTGNHNIWSQDHRYSHLLLAERRKYRGFSESVRALHYLGIKPENYNPDFVQAQKVYDSSQAFLIFYHQGEKIYLSYLDAEKLVYLYRTLTKTSETKPTVEEVRIHRNKPMYIRDKHCTCGCRDGQICEKTN